jgi:hypothetical protein
MVARPDLFSVLPEAARGDALLARIALQSAQRSDQVLPFVAPSLLSDRAFQVFAVLNTRGVALGQVPDALLTAPGFLSEATQFLSAEQKLAALASVPAHHFESLAFLALAVAETPAAFGLASASLRADPLVVRRLLDRTQVEGFGTTFFDPSTSVLAYAAPPLLADRAFARDIVGQFPNLIAAFPREVQADPHVMDAALEASPMSAGRLLAPVTDRQRALELVRRNGLYLKALDYRLMSDPEIVAAALESDPMSVSVWGGPAALRRRSVELQPMNIANWPVGTPTALAEVTAMAERDGRLLGLRRRDSMTSPQRALLDQVAAARPDLAAASDALMARFEAAHIGHPERLGDLRTAMEILHQTETAGAPTDDPRPLAVVAYSPEDWNQAFLNSQFHRLTRGYRVVYFEASTDEALREGILRATESSQAALLVLGAHGSQHLMALGADDPARGAPLAAETAYLSEIDVTEWVARGVGARLVEGAPVVLKSCKTGLGREEPNVANALATVFPGNRIFAPITSTNNQMVLDDDGRFVAPGYFDGPGYGYTVEPRRREGPGSVPVAG